jgi:hypothetical protein
MKLLTTTLISLTLLASVVMGGCTSDKSDEKSAQQQTTTETVAQNKESTTEKDTIAQKSDDKPENPEVAPKEDHAHEGGEPHSHADGSDHAGDSKGGQVLQLDGYRLKFIAERGADESHLHLFLDKGNNSESVADATVKAQVQTPDGKEKTLNLKYDEKEKGYLGVLNNLTAGKHQVRFLVNVGGKNLNGRFQFE